MDSKTGSTSHYQPKAWVTLLSSIIGAFAIIWAAVISSNAKRDLEVQGAEIRRLQAELQEARQSAVETDRDETKGSSLRVSHPVDDSPGRPSKVDSRHQENVTPKPASPEIDPPLSVAPRQFQASIQEYDFVLERCARESSDVICWISVTNEGKGRELKIFVDDSWLRDQDSTKHEVTRAFESIDEKVINILTIDLPKGTSARFGLQFQGAGGTAASVRFLKIHASGFKVELQGEMEVG